MPMRWWIGLYKASQWLRHQESLTPLLLQRPSRVLQHQQWVSLHCFPVAVTGKKKQAEKKHSMKKCQSRSNHLPVDTKGLEFLCKKDLTVICGAHSLKLRSLTPRFWNSPWHVSWIIFWLILVQLKSTLWRGLNEQNPRQNENTQC